MLENLKAFIRHGKQANDLRKKPISNPIVYDYTNGFDATSSSGAHTTATATVHASGENVDEEVVQDNYDIRADNRNYQQEVPNELIAAPEVLVEDFDEQSYNRRHKQDPNDAFEQDRNRERIHDKVNDTHTQARENRNYKEAATHIVEEERILREKAVKYPNLDNYSVLEKMGEGAFSVVYKARHLVSQQLVAIKILRKFQMDQTQKQAVLKEVAIMRQLDHPNIVRFIEFVDSEPYYYIVQELAVGGEIFSSIVKYTYFSEDLTRHVITQVAEALRYLHEEVGIVHRDIKPENLLFMPIEVTPSLNPIAKLRKSDDPSTKLDEGDFVPGVGGGGIGVVKVADFGLSKQIWEHNTKTPCGTVGYTAPEIVRDERYSKEVDMWAMGCVLYTLLCGFPPFYDERIETLTEKVARGEYTFLSPWWDEISDEAKHCVQKLLTVNPSKRYSVDDLLNDPWMTKSAHKQQKPEPVQSVHAAQPATSSRAHPIAKYSKKFTDGMYSPAATALRDVFDVSTAVHRMGEEAALSSKLNREILEEEEEEDEDDYATFNVKDVKGSSQAPRFKQEDLFNLNITGASILERRRNKDTIEA